MPTNADGHTVTTNSLINKTVSIISITFLKTFNSNNSNLYIYLFLPFLIYIKKECRGYSKVINHKMYSVLFIKYQISI